MTIIVQSVKIVISDTRVRKLFYRRVAFSPWLRSGAHVHTEIKSLFRTCNENNYSITINAVKLL